MSAIKQWHPATAPRPENNGPRECSEQRRFGRSNRRTDRPRSMDVCDVWAGGESVARSMSVGCLAASESCTRETISDKGCVLRVVWALVRRGGHISSWYARAQDRPDVHVLRTGHRCCAGLCRRAEWVGGAPGSACGETDGARCEWVASMGSAGSEAGAAVEGRVCTACGIASVTSAVSSLQRYQLCTRFSSLCKPGSGHQERGWTQPSSTGFILESFTVYIYGYVFVLILGYIGVSLEFYTTALG